MITGTSVAPLSKEQVLIDAIIARQNEILVYQINIDNYAAMLEAADDEDDPDIAASMPEHRDRIAQLLKSEKLEQKKSRMVLAQLEKQLAAL